MQNTLHMHILNLSSESYKFISKDYGFEISNIHTHNITLVASMWKFIGMDNGINILMCMDGKYICIQI